MPGGLRPPGISSARETLSTQAIDRPAVYPGQDQLMPLTLPSTPRLKSGTALSFGTLDGR